MIPVMTCRTGTSDNDIRIFFKNRNQKKSLSEFALENTIYWNMKLNARNTQEGTQSLSPQTAPALRDSVV